MDGSGHWHDETSIGDTCCTTLTTTEMHLVVGAGLIGDYNPLHVNEAFARRSRYGTRILHGMITSAVMGGPLGMYFHGTAIAYLEHRVRFKSPVKVGDTLATTWTITGRDDKPKHAGGVVARAGRASPPCARGVATRPPSPARTRRRCPGRGR